ncbi:uncharacterized protein LOC128897001 [Hylaeus anthracinus]|uniref:uncharacterized protein LOC128897001 n=1 Tax=Hylaeus anthracinus TaxID=313031 RepID=UPI0023B8BF2F|nr:uncharacterized protein LOC128897001 [Hylaeus anthracinus]
MIITHCGQFPRKCVHGKIETNDLAELKSSRGVRILGRRYPLTTTWYKYLDIGIRIGRRCDVELAIGDNRGNEIQFPMFTWKKLSERKMDILRNFEMTSSDPIRVCDITIEFRCVDDVKVAKLSTSVNALFLTEKTICRMFDFEYCINHMYTWLSENTFLVERRYETFVKVIHNVKPNDIVRTITEDENFERHSLIDSELLALGLNVIQHCDQIK